MLYSYWKNCSDFHPSEIRHLLHMVNDAKEITFRTFFQYCKREEAYKLFDYERDKRKGLTLEQDTHVRYYQSTYKGERCFYLVHSAIEYIFMKGEQMADNPYQDMTHDDEVRILERIVREEGASILSIGDVYVELREHFNNEILDIWLAERQTVAAPGEPLPPAEYARRKGGFCPVCGSLEIEGESWEPKDNVVTQDVSCSECYASWTDTYRLFNYYDLETPEPEE